MNAILFKVASALSLGIFTTVWAVNVLMTGQTMVIDLGIPYLGFLRPQEIVYTIYSAIETLPH